MGQFLFCWSVLTLGQEPEQIDVTQFVRLVEAKVAPLQDLSCLYEGTVRWVGPRSVLGRDVETFGERYQGAYLYRRNDAALRDTYRRSRADPSLLSRHRDATLRGKAHRLVVYANEKRRAGAKPDIQETGGGMYALNGPASPHLLFRMWYLLSLASDPKSGFRAIGWDTLGSRRCFRFRIGSLGGEEATGDYEDYWIDLERGANVLKVENFQKGHLAVRVDQVKLSEVTLADRATVWVPVHARKQSFVWTNTVSASPLNEEIIEVVNGTLLLNQGLPDAIFDVSREIALPVKGELERLRRQASDASLAREFESAPVEQHPRHDQAGARARLEKSLIEAEKQAKALEASAPSRESWTWVGASQVVAFAAGLGLIVSAIILRRRAS